MNALLLAAFALTVGASDTDLQRPRRGAGIAEGQPAMDFTLKQLKADKTFTLSSNFGKRPTVLIFGSYT
jgi:cytochrome oxidase Cu insertion factor (SCO1/SenC/PrrC family)